MGNLLTKKNEWFEVDVENYSVLEMRVCTKCSRRSLYMLIYYFHFNEQCTSTLSRWGESLFDDYDDDDAFA